MVREIDWYDFFLYTSDPHFSIFRPLFQNVAMENLSKFLMKDVHESYLSEVKPTQEKLS